MRERRTRERAHTICVSCPAFSVSEGSFAHENTHLRMSWFEPGFETASMQRLAASRANRCNKNAAQGVYGRIVLALAAGELEEVLDLHACGKDRGVKLAREQLFQCLGKRRG